MRTKNKNYAQPAYQLYRQLIEPIEPYFTGTNLLIIPDGKLAHLPFDALLRSPENDNGSSSTSFLVNSYRIHYAGSLALSSVLDPAEDRTYSSDFFGFAPSYKNSGPSARQTSRGSWRPLTTSAYEVNKIANLFDEKNAGFFSSIFGSRSKAKTLTNRKATESAFKKASLSNYRIIHLAAHAFPSDSTSGSSGIVFNASNESDEDDILYSSEIYSLKLNNELAVLSACDTGGGTIVEGEGVMGLSRAFQYAGTANLLVSLWQVEDRSTSTLMVNFYRSVVDELPYAQALRKAKMQLAQNAQYEHPRYWAPFVLYGN
jgi:CHAT domain-containing protein